MAQDLSGLYISQSFQNLVQRSASGAFNVLATATGTEFIPVSASYAISASKADSVVSASYAEVNLQEVLQNGNSASIAINLTASLNTTGSLTEHKNEFKVTAQDKDTDFDVAAFKIRNNNSGKTQITGSVNITGSSSVEGISTVSLNSAGTAAKLIIKDDANDSFSVGPTIRFTGSKVGLIETEKNLQFDVGSTGDTIFNAGRQYLFTKDNFQSGDFKITDNGSRSTLYKHENLTETGSIRFANTTTDAGIAIRMDDNKMALQMYSGSSFVPIIQRASGSKQVNLYDSTSSTGSSAQVLTSNANGGIEWGVGAADPFPFTGSAQITGSLIVTGSVNLGNFNSLNTLGTSINALVHGDGNSILSGEDNVIIGGEGNSAGNGVGYSGIYSAAASQLSNTDTSVIVGGYQNRLQAARSFIVAGNDNQVTDSGATFSGIIGGQGHRISSAITASAIIGGRNFTATKGDTVYVPSLEAYQGGANITGSIVGSAGAAFGASSGAFSSDAITLGNTSTPIQYGNIQIHQNSTTNTGNYFNGFQIIDTGGVVTEMANSAFTGLGNNIQYLGMGPNSPNRTDAIKLWTTGSNSTLNVATNLKITDGLDIAMSGSIELASNTGSAGQVIGVDSSGKAKWQNNNNSFSWTGTSYTQATAPGCDYVFAVTDVIPGGTFGPGDILEVRSMDQKAGSSGTTYTLIAAVNTGSLSAGVARPANFRGFSQNQESSDGKIYYQKTIYIDTAGSSSLWDEGNSTETYQNGVVGGDPMTEYSPAQLNWANDVVVFYGACIDNAGTTLQNFGGTIRKIN